METADDEENDELPDCANEAVQNTKQSKPKQCLNPRIVWFNVKSHHHHELIMFFTSWWNEETDILGNSSSYQECFLLLKNKIDKQTGQYAISREDLNEIEEQLHKTDHTDDQFDSIAPNTQNVELQDKAFSNEDLHLDFNENYVMSGDLGIPSTSFNNEPLMHVLNELPGDDYC